MIAAILRAQYLSMRFAGRRGTIFSALTGAIWYAIWLFVAVGAAVFLVGAQPRQLQLYLPLGFLGVCGYWQLIPVLTASMGSGLDLRKLLVYPLPHAKLFVVEILLRLTTGAEMLLVLAGGAAGLLLNPWVGGWRAAPRLAAAMLIFVVFNLLLASGLRSLLERLLTRRKVREVLSFLLLLIYVAPRLLLQSGARPRNLHGLNGLAQAVEFPWSAAARLAIPAGARELEWLALLSLCGWTVLALYFGRAQFERNLRYDAAAAQATPLRPGSSLLQRWMERFYRVPSLVWRDPLAGMIEKELRSLARTPRFRMVFIMGFTFGLVVWLPMVMGRHVAQSSDNSSYFLIIVCTYALTLLGQVSYWNCFGFDRSAVVFYFAAPQKFSTTLIGKNIASLFYIYIEVLLLSGITAALRVSGGWGTMVESLLVIGVCSLYMLALGNIASVQFPRPLTPERVSQGGTSGRLQGLIFLLYPLALLPVFLAYLARYAFNSETVFAIALALAALAGAVLYWTALKSAVSTVDRRREQFLNDLSKGDGPVVSE